MYKRSEHGTERNKRLIDFGLSLFRLKLGHPLAAVIGQFERPAAVCDQSRTVVIVSRSQPATLATALNRRFCRCCRLALVLFHCVIWNWWSRLCIWYVYFYRFKCYSSVKHYIIALHVLCTLFFVRNREDAVVVNLWLPSAYIAPSIENTAAFLAAIRYTDKISQ